MAVLAANGKMQLQCQTADAGLLARCNAHIALRMGHHRPKLTGPKELAHSDQLCKKREKRDRQARKTVTPRSAEMPHSGSTLSPHA